MDPFMLEDEGVRDRIRQAVEFLDPSMQTTAIPPHDKNELTRLQPILMLEATDQTLF